MKNSMKPLSVLYSDMLILTEPFFSSFLNGFHGLPVFWPPGFLALRIYGFIAGKDGLHGCRFFGLLVHWLFISGSINGHYDCRFYGLQVRWLLVSNGFMALYRPLIPVIYHSLRY
ncbi:hypothetical protein CU097_003790 [Rhizopus azygosporus]|uniref:Uncharacterized protein n=1 Tax=Rhizopus azygosporus TaxID=86630 RepID=A0A367JZN8_RHIAZ|nr:hypothetical protein CU097_003790 [Rhizopus azygosporus]